MDYSQHHHDGKDDDSSSSRQRGRRLWNNNTTTTSSSSSSSSSTANHLLFANNISASLRNDLEEALEALLNATRKFTAPILGRTQVPIVHLEKINKKNRQAGTPPSLLSFENNNNNDNDDTNNNSSLSSSSFNAFVNTFVDLYIAVRHGVYQLELAIMPFWPQKFPPRTTTKKNATDGYTTSILDEDRLEADLKLLVVANVYNNNDIGDKSTTMQE